MPQPASTSSNPTLTPVGKQAGHPIITLSRPYTLAGASSRAAMRLEAKSVSRFHCIIIRSGRDVFIRDLASRNGTYVNKNKITERTLHGGDIVHIGDRPFQFRCRGSRDLPQPSLPPTSKLTGQNWDGAAISGKSLLIGRREGCDVILDSNDVAAAHAIIFAMDGAHHLLDLNSPAGTRLNGATITRAQQLSQNDEIEIAGTVMRYESSQPTPSRRKRPAVEDSDAPLPLDIDLEEDEPQPKPTPKKPEKTAKNPPVIAKAAAEAITEPEQPAERTELEEENEEEDAISLADIRDFGDPLAATSESPDNAPIPLTDETSDDESQISNLKSDLSAPNNEDLVLEALNEAPSAGAPPAESLITEPLDTDIPALPLDSETEIPELLDIPQDPTATPHTVTATTTLPQSEISADAAHDALIPIDLPKITTEAAAVADAEESILLELDGAVSSASSAPPPSEPIESPIAPSNLLGDLATNPPHPVSAEPSTASDSSSDLHPIIPEISAARAPLFDPAESFESPILAAESEPEPPLDLAEDTLIASPVDFQATLAPETGIEPPTTTPVETIVETISEFPIREIVGVLADAQMPTAPSPSIEQPLDLPPPSPALEIHPAKPTSDSISETPATSIAIFSETSTAPSATTSAVEIDCDDFNALIDSLGEPPSGVPVNQAAAPLPEIQQLAPSEVARAIQTDTASQSHSPTFAPGKAHGPAVGSAKSPAHPAHSDVFSIPTQKSDWKTSPDPFAIPSPAALPSVSARGTVATSSPASNPGQQSAPPRANFSAVSARRRSKAPFYLLLVLIAAAVVFWSQHRYHSAGDVPVIQSQPTSNDAQSASMRQSPQ